MTIVMVNDCVLTLCIILLGKCFRKSFNDTKRGDKMKGGRMACSECLGAESCWGGVRSAQADPLPPAPLNPRT